MVGDYTSSLPPARRKGLARCALRTTLGQFLKLSAMAPID
jgi:hypothetical protein